MTKLTCLLTASLFFVAPAIADPHGVYGTYTTQDGNARIQIEDCGDATPCGRIVWFDTADLPAGETMESYIGKNGEQLLGSTMLWGFSRKKNDWRGGRIYNDENGKTYASRLKRLEDGALQVKGCIGPICQTQLWPEHTQ